MSNQEVKPKGKPYPQNHTIHSRKESFRIAFLINNEQRLNMSVKDYNELRLKVEKLSSHISFKIAIQDYIQSQVPNGIGVVVESLK